MSDSPVFPANEIGDAAYVPFYKDTLQALMNLDADDIKSYIEAIYGYVYEGAMPDCGGAAKAVFVMGRYQLDQAMNRASTNRKNAKGKRKKSESVATGERTGSETVANDERTGSETEATGEPDENETAAKRDIFKDLSSNVKDQSSRDKEPSPNTQVSGKPVSMKSKRFKPPSHDEWWSHWREKCAEYGVPPNRIEAEGGYAFYDANGWLQANGNRITRWRSCVTTCLFKAHPELKTKSGSEGDGDGYFSAATRAAAELTEHLVQPTLTG